MSLSTVITTAKQWIGAHLAPIISAVFHGISSEQIQKALELVKEAEGLYTVAADKFKHVATALNKIWPGLLQGGNVNKPTNTLNLIISAALNIAEKFGIIIKTINPVANAIASVAGLPPIDDSATGIAGNVQGLAQSPLNAPAAPDPLGRFSDPTSGSPTPGSQTSAPKPVTPPATAVPPSSPETTAGSPTTPTETGSPTSPPETMSTSPASPESTPAASA